MRQTDAAARGDRDPRQLLEAVIDANRYLTLATADGEGRPWASPVWFADRDHEQFLWVSRPDARHSRNLAQRAEVAIAVFDSSAAVGSAQAVYAQAVARELTAADELRDAIEAYSRRSVSQGAAAWTLDDVGDRATHRLYRADASALFVLGADDRRIPVPLRGSGPDPAPVRSSAG